MKNDRPARESNDAAFSYPCEVDGDNLSCGGLDHATDINDAIRIYWHSNDLRNHDDELCSRAISKYTEKMSLVML
jgi:hypothetical protein